MVEDSHKIIMYTCDIHNISTSMRLGYLFLICYNEMHILLMLVCFLCVFLQFEYLFIMSVNDFDAGEIQRYVGVSFGFGTKC